MSTLLSGIQNELQILADSTSSALNLDIEFIDSNLRRVACTGFARPLVGCYLTPHGVLNHSLFLQKERRTIIQSPGNDERCCNCTRFHNCPWMASVHTSIWVNGEPVGIFGLTATNKAQAEFLSTHFAEMSQFTDSLAELLSGYMQFQISAKSLTRVLPPSWQALPSADPFPRILSADPAFLLFKEKAAKLARYSSTVLLTGETGTGKELFSRGIHELSLRSTGPFVAINCGAIPEHLIESELFGYRKGAFTGANSDRQGRFLAASHGTLFLDEVENMPLYLQQKLLRVLETHEIEPLGSARPVPVDLRIIAATNRPLHELVEKGTFREDLFHRLNVISLKIPPLRERGNDVLFLSGHMIEKYNRTFQKQVSGLSAEVQSLFLSYPWKGNIRELQNTLEYAVCMCDGDQIGLQDLPDYLLAIARRTIPGIYPALSVSEGTSRNVSARSASSPEASSLEFSALTPALSALSDDARKIKEALDEFGWHEEGRLKAAAELGISRSTLYRKIKKYNLRMPRS